MCSPFCEFYKKVVLQLSEYGDVIETQTVRIVPPKVFWQTRSLDLRQLQQWCQSYLNTLYYLASLLSLKLLQLPRWCCAECAIHHERDAREEQNHIYVARTSNNRVISSGKLYCCLLSQCEALRTCHSGFPIAAEQ